MSEKRFRVRFEQEDGRGEIVNEKGVELTAREVVDLLNEQQATINEYKENWDSLVEKASEIAKRNVVLDERIGQLQRENDELLKEKDYWKKQAMTLLMQVRRLTPRMTDEEVKEFSKELEDGDGV